MNMTRAADALFAVLAFALLSPPDTCDCDDPMWPHVPGGRAS